MRGAVLSTAGQAGRMRHAVENGVESNRNAAQANGRMSDSGFFQTRHPEALPSDNRPAEDIIADLTAALEAKSLLLEEVDHRIKNSLAMVGALLRLQARTIADPSVAATLDTMLERVDAVATVHRRLHRSGDTPHFDVAALAEELAGDIVGASGRTNITIVLACTSLPIEPAMASPMGLILNEVLTNAVKHGFAEGRAGTLTVASRTEHGQGIIEIRDDGPGIEAAEVGRPLGMGRMLIQRLGRQARTEVTWIATHPGTSVRLTFPTKN